MQGSLLTYNGVRWLKTIDCPLCGAAGIMLTVSPEQEQAIKDGKFVQDVFPKLHASIRERCINGVCVPCQRKMEAGDETVN